MTEHKGYRILPLDNLIGYGLQHIGRGSIPKALQGSFTSKRDAIKMIDGYKGKEEVDGEAEATSGVEPLQRGTNHGRKPAKQS